MFFAPLSGAICSGFRAVYPQMPFQHRYFAKPAVKLSLKTIFLVVRKEDGRPGVARFHTQIGHFTHRNAFCLLDYRKRHAVEVNIMIEIEDLSENEIIEMLERVGYGHLACCRDDRPYVVPIHYAFDAGNIYIYTTEGKKADIVRKNPNVCLQIEEVKDNFTWQSIIVDGTVTRVEYGEEHDLALKLIVSANPTLTPAVSIRWMDEWVRENIEVIYRLTPAATSGRRAVNRMGNTPFVPGGIGAKDNIN